MATTPMDWDRSAMPPPSDTMLRERDARATKDVKNQVENKTTHAKAPRRKGPPSRQSIFPLRFFASWRLCVRLFILCHVRSRKFIENKRKSERMHKATCRQRSRHRG